MDSIDTIYEVFASRLKEAPETPAVFDETRTLTRRQLDRLADTIAARLPAQAKRIGLVLDHGVEMIAALLAILKRGAAYVPAENDFPRERIHFMLTDAKVDCVITQDRYQDRVTGFPLVLVEPGLAPDKNAPVSEPTAAPDDLAYILYTSGSTGAPKGVAVRNRNVCHYVRAFRHEFAPRETDIMLQYSVCTFDIFVEEVFTTLLSGAVLAIPRAETRADMAQLLAFTDRHQVTIISGFPYLLAELNTCAKLPPSLRLLISGGDVLRASYVTQLLDKVAVYNTYGPSETTVCVTFFHCNKARPLSDGTYPIGTPVRGSRILLLDDRGQPVPAGEVGEICILGGGVAAGYINRPAADTPAFTTTPEGEALYHSGDLARLLPDGNLAFLHRQDQQVMIRGKRVEPEEVENVLFHCPEIKQGAVRAFLDEQRLAYLVAYVVPQEPAFQLSVLKQQMAEFLPPYMIPEFFVRLDTLPMTPNGKVDGDALPVVLKAVN